MDDDLYRLLVRLGLSDLWSRSIVHMLKIAIIVVAALLAARLVTRAAQRSVRALVSRAPLGDAARLQARAETLAGVVGSAIRITVWTIAGLVVIDELGLNVGPLIAGAGIIGIALAFGAQSLVRDVVSGFFILAEDQFGVGDVVNLDGVNGTVEEVNLRLTRLRSADGTVWFVPNGELKKVGNASKGWSRALVDVVVPLKLELQAAMRVIEDTAKALVAEGEWADDVISAPEVWGVESMAVDSVTVRVAVMTRPQRQLALARELRVRVTVRLQELVSEDAG